MKRILLPLTAAILLLAGVAVAQPHMRHMGTPDGMPPAAMHERMLEHMTKALGLTDEQKAAATKIHEETMKTVEPLFEQQRALHEQVESALENGSDAATVGALVISSYKNRQAIKAAHEDAMKEFEALLTAEQLKKLQSMKEMHGEDCGPGCFHGHGHDRGFGG